MRTTNLLIFVAMLCCMVTAIAAPDSGFSGRRIVPILDVPLRDTAISRGPDGTYYLTGTAASKKDGVLDFQNNDGVWLWKSTDLIHWEAMGQVWSISRDPKRFGNPHYGTPSMWQLAWRPAKDPAAQSPARGINAPEIHFVKGNFYITYSMNGHGCGLLQSETGKAEGPYRDLGPMTRSGGDPSLFEDSDGSVYFVWGDGWIARMNDNLTGLAEAPRVLEVKPEVENGSWPLRIGTGGAFLFKAPSPGLKHGEYHLVGCEEIGRMGGVPCRDTFIATAESVYGPYQRRDLMVPHGGQSTVFQGPTGQYFATFSGGDEWAAFCDKPGIVPLVPHATVFGSDYWWCGAFVKPWYPVSERGAWSEINPFVEKPGFRDASVLNAPDGFYYLTGSIFDFIPKKGQAWDRSKIGIQVWRSRDMKDWQEMGVVWKCDEEEERFFAFGNPDGGHLAGEFSFLRVTRSTLADSKTTINELRAWQFDGPHLRDFSGQPRDFAHGPAGALDCASQK